MSADAPIGVIGLGLMGAAFAARLIDAGQAAVGFDIDRSRCDALKAMGGEVGGSVRNVGERCPTIVIAVYNAQQVEALLDELEGDGRNAPLLICTTTCAPDEIIAIAAHAARAGLAFVEAPVSGTSTEARDGTATALLAGEANAIEAAQSVLAILCPKRLYVRRIGDASRTKLAINLILQINRTALAEGIVFAESLGLDATAFLDAARQSAAYSSVMDIKGAKMLARDFTPQSRIAQSVKDSELILREAKERNLHLPMTSVQMALLRAAIALEGPDCDSAAIIAAIDRARIKL
ncbi:NAD(P)-dependent oxidoreductase [Bradyrhizobium sp.]|jgi:3-hydroxyisobutyrate dehydrogenase-like beta-hydroxyacid dehydrogenase|uniref:NAD(P)-dependent oxidoreductase n=1 Tax=Bradyrhizobium sp. TaxID=376 RepID=UPI002C1D93EA|nr:NAD(P)-dependent oxidoreductase [Bradyrhizobium sp.]HWX62561.1 NAD(P)-dependent oxidoreductase [Bradyrhizobium sp.]